MWCEQCKRIVYIGKAMIELRQRFHGHRSDMKRQDEDNLVQHFKENGHGEQDTRVVALEAVPGKEDRYRIDRESWWIEKMGDNGRRE
jgi:hypothetical protein